MAMVRDAYGLQVCGEALNGKIAYPRLKVARLGNFSLEHRKHLSESHKGKKSWDRNHPSFSLIQQKCKEAACRQWQDSREKMLAIFASTEYKSKLSEKQRSLWRSPEERVKRITGIKNSSMPASIKKLWKQKWYIDMQRKKHLEVFEKLGCYPLKNTTIERLLYRTFLRRGLPLLQNRRIENVAVPDFVNFEFGIAIFADGDFWHCNPEKYEMTRTWQFKRVSRDFEANRQLEKKGFAILRFYETEIKENPERCADLVERTLMIHGWIGSPIN